MSRSTEGDRIGSRCWRVCGADLINRGGHDQVTVELNMIMVKITSLVISHKPFRVSFAAKTCIVWTQKISPKINRSVT